MLIGEYAHNLDLKGRIIIPSKFRSDIGQNFVLTKGLDGCLFVFPKNEWQKFEEKLSSLPLTSKDARLFTRYFVASAYDVESDKQGRFLIPQNLQQFAKLEKEVIIIGMNTRIEIWAKSEWEKFNNELTDDELASKMESIGI